MTSPGLRPSSLDLRRNATTGAAAEHPSASGIASTASAVLASRYEILALLGVGGMGSVYRARDRELDEDVALKVLRRELLVDPGMIERFRREVKIARRVTHPNVVRTFDIGDHDGDKFLTMELVLGEPLSARIDRRASLPIAEVKRVVTSICAGLEAAHAAGVVHRDLKPDNVLIAHDGRVAISDFGIARAVQLGSKTLGLALGTPLYMAPEQVLARADVDGRADIYALGVILYEMLSFRAAWDGETPYAIAVARLLSAPPDVRAVADVSDALATIVLRCMAREPSERYASAAEVREAISRVDVPAAIDRRLSVPPPRPVSRIPPGIRTVAVLPFRDGGGAAHLAKGLPEILAEALGAHPSLRLRSRGEVSRLRDPRGELRAAGRELGAEVVVGGSVRVDADRIHVFVRLISVSDGIQLWADRVDERLGDAILVIDRAARQIARALTVAEPAALAPDPADARAAELFFRARADRADSAADANDRAIASLEAALSRAPDDPWINASYAVALTRRMFEIATPIEELREADAMAAKAREAAPGLVEPYVAQAWLRIEQADYEGAALALAAIAPRSSCGDLHHATGLLLSLAGDLDNGVAELRTAAAMQTLVAPPRAHLARAYALAGEWTLADAVMDGAPASDRRWPLFWTHTARLALWRRDTARARAALEALEKRPIACDDLARAVLGATITADPTNALALASVLREESAAHPRARGELAQIVAELEALRGHNAEALTAIAEVGAVGLVDVRWLDDCPLLAPLRRSGALAGARAHAGARADVILRALSATGFDLPYQR